MPKFQSTKVFDGFSCVFRQWKAEGTHCRFLHGYGSSVLKYGSKVNSMKEIGFGTLAV